jgi:hypothetical protein
MKKACFLFLALFTTGVSWGQLSGTKTIKASGGDYSTFTQAITALNTSGVGAGGVIFNVDPDLVSVETCPVITATGTSANPVVFQKSGAGANPVIKPTGIGGTADAGIAIRGGDYITFDGIDVATNSDFGVEHGYYVSNFSNTNGAQHNTIKNCTITLFRGYLNTRGIYQNAAANPTNANGANSYNTYENIFVQNSYWGMYLKGLGTFPDLSCVVKNNTVGAASANDIANGSNTACGIRIYASSGLSVFNNEIRNITVSGSSLYGLWLETLKGTNNNVYNNKIHSLTCTNWAYSSVVYGMLITCLNSNIVNGNVYNNMIYALEHGADGSATTKVIQAMGLTGTNATFNICFNSVRIDEDAYPASTCFYNTGIVTLKNNIFANFSAPHPSGAISKFCISNAGVISAADYNDYHIISGTNNYVGSSGNNYATLADWKAGTGFDANSVDRDPMFQSATDLHIQPVISPVRGAGVTIPGITTDIDGNTRSDQPTIGAAEAAPIVAPIPTVSEWGLILLGLTLLGFGTIFILRRG